MYGIYVLYVCALYEYIAYMHYMYELHICDVMYALLHVCTVCIWYMVHMYVIYDTCILFMMHACDIGTCIWHMMHVYNTWYMYIIHDALYIAKGGKERLISILAGQAHVTSKTCFLSSVFVLFVGELFVYYYFLPVFLRQDLDRKPRLALNSWFSCLGFSSAEIIGAHHQSPTSVLKHLISVPLSTNEDIL